MQRKLLGIINVGSNATGRLLINYSAFVKFLRKKWEYNEAVHQLFIDFKKAYDSVRMGVLYNTVTASGYDQFSETHKEMNHRHTKSSKPSKWQCYNMNNSIN